MPVDPDAVGATSEPVDTTWSSEDALLYALGVGAGVDDLAFTTENSTNVEQRVLPTMAVVLANLGSAFAKIGTFNPVMLVHGSQRVEWAGEIPVRGTVTTTTEVTGVYDKGSGALVEMTARSTLQQTGEPIFTNVTSAFIRGEGGWGGGRGPSGGANAAPEREPDHELAYPTSRDQALLYRLSGDRNPLHSDPEFAKMAGFERPILHGLCSYGFTGRALLRALAGDDPARLRSMEGRFSSPVYPGETLTVRIWRTAEGRAVFRTHGDGGRVVIDAGGCTFG